MIIANEIAECVTKFNNNSLKETMLLGNVHKDIEIAL